MDELPENEVQILFKLYSLTFKLTLVPTKTKYLDTSSCVVWPDFSINNNITENSTSISKENKMRRLLLELGAKIEISNKMLKTLSI